mgnify:CR=1 FL=1
MVRYRFVLMTALVHVSVWGCGSEDTTSPNATAAFEGQMTSYPDGPYGDEVGDVIENTTLTTGTDESVSLQSLHQDPTRHLMLIFGTAGWCGRCRIHMPTLKAIYEELGSQGVYVALSIHENRVFGPAEPRDALNFRRLHQLPFPVFADTDGHLTQYYNEVSIPMVMVVDLRTMVLLYAEHVWEPDDVRALLETHL